MTAGEHGISLQVGNNFCNFEGYDVSAELAAILGAIAVAEAYTGEASSSSGDGQLSEQVNAALAAHAGHCHHRHYHRAPRGFLPTKWQNYSNLGTCLVACGSAQASLALLGTRGQVG